MSLLKLLDDKSFKTDPSNQRWYQFVSDHRDIIREKGSDYVTITPNLMHSLQFELMRLYRHLKRPPQYSWIVYLINPGLLRNMDFKDISGIYLPKDDYMLELYQQFRQIEESENE